MRPLLLHKHHHQLFLSLHPTLHFDGVTRRYVVRLDPSRWRPNFELLNVIIGKNVRKDKFDLGGCKESTETTPPKNSFVRKKNKVPSISQHILEIEKWVFGLIRGGSAFRAWSSRLFSRCHLGYNTSVECP